MAIMVMSNISNSFSFFCTELLLCIFDELTAENPLVIFFFKSFSSIWDPPFNILNKKYYEFLFDINFYIFYFTKNSCMIKPNTNRTNILLYSTFDSTNGG